MATVQGYALPGMGGNRLRAARPRQFETSQIENEMDYEIIRRIEKNQGV